MTIREENLCRIVHNSPQDIRVIGKVRKTQDQNPEVGHTQGEIQKKLQKSTLAFNRG
jgi:hypothetical protein